MKDVPRLAGAGQRAVIDACLESGVSFWWRTPGTLLVEGSGVHQVIGHLLAQGHRVLGVEGFELESRIIHPRIDLIRDAERTPDLLAAIKTWDNGVYVDKPDLWVDISVADGDE